MASSRAGGAVPVSPLCARLRVRRSARPVSDSGTSPVSALSERSRCCSLVRRRPSSEGMGPARQSCVMDSHVRLVSDAMDTGRARGIVLPLRRLQPHHLAARSARRSLASTPPPRWPRWTVLSLPP